jgi:uncharacterized membrane protein YfcA
LLLPILIITDVAAVWLYRRDFSSRNVTILLPAILLGIGIATLLLPYASEPFLLAFTGVVGLWTVGRSWLASATSQPTEPKLVPGLIWGTIAGITTFITHSGAPPMQAYLLPQKLSRLVFAGTMAIVFAIGNIAKIPSYAALGFFEEIDPMLLGGLAIVGIIGTIVGRWIVLRLTDKGYIRLIEVMLLALSVLLLAKAASLVFSA